MLLFTFLSNPPATIHNNFCIVFRIPVIVPSHMLKRDLYSSGLWTTALCYPNPVCSHCLFNCDLNITFESE